MVIRLRAGGMCPKTPQPPSPLHYTEKDEEIGGNLLIAHPSCSQKKGSQSTRTVFLVVASWIVLSTIIIQQTYQNQNLVQLFMGDTVYPFIPSPPQNREEGISEQPNGLSLVTMAKEKEEYSALPNIDPMDICTAVIGKNKEDEFSITNCRGHPDESKKDDPIICYGDDDDDGHHSSLYAAFGLLPQSQLPSLHQSCFFIQTNNKNVLHEHLLRLYPNSFLVVSTVSTLNTYMYFDSTEEKIINTQGMIDKFELLWKKKTMGISMWDFIARESQHVFSDCDWSFISNVMGAQNLVQYLLCPI